MEHTAQCAVLQSAMLPTTWWLTCQHCASNSAILAARRGDLPLCTKIQIMITDALALRRKLRCTTHFSIPQLTMVTHQWLEKAVACADKAIRLWQQQNSHENDSQEAAALSDSFPDSQPSTEMPSVNDNPPACGSVSIGD